VGVVWLDSNPRHCERNDRGRRSALARRWKQSRATRATLDLRRCAPRNDEDRAEPDNYSLWFPAFARTTVAPAARLPPHFFAIAHAGSGGPKASSPEILARIL